MPRGSPHDQAENNKNCIEQALYWLDRRSRQRQRPKKSVCYWLPLWERSRRPRPEGQANNKNSNA